MQKSINAKLIPGPKLQPEEQFIINCLRSEFSEESYDKIAEVDLSIIDWDVFFKKSMQCGVAALIYKILENNPSFFEFQSIPDHVLHKMAIMYLRTFTLNNKSFEELARVLEDFNAEGIKVVLLKGSFLAQFVYQDIGLRPMCDIDILVRKEDILQIDRIMSGLGYLFFGNKPLEWYRENFYHICYKHPKKSIMFEIHWHIASKSHPFQLRVLNRGIIKKWWERAQSVKFFGKKAFVLCPDDLIFHLSIHFLKHRFFSQKGGFNGNFNTNGALIQICDIFQTLRHYADGINWLRFKSESENYGVDSLIYTTLYIVREIMGNHDNVFHKVLGGFTSESLDKDLIQLISKRILLMENDFNLIPIPLMQQQLARPFHEKVKILPRLIIPKQEVIAKKYSIPQSSKRLYIYYFIRPFILLLKYGKVVLEIPRIREEVILKRWING